MVRAIRAGTPRTTFLRKIHFLVMAAALLVASSGAWAQRVEGDRARAEGIYATEVSVNGQGETERNAAFARGLAQVLGKLSGDRSVTSKPGVGNELRQARTYVKQYDYRQDEGVGPTGAPSFRTLLVIQYDEEAVNDLAATLGISIWPQPRPKPVLWLAIDDGSGPRLVGLPQVNAARPALNRAVERGYKLGLPTGNAAEQAAVGAIWRGDSAAVARASARYSPPMQLIGKLYRDTTAGWKADWTFVDAGKVLANWSQTGADARQLMAGGADGAADALMKRYAKRAPSGEPGLYRVTFTGIDSSDDFIRLAGYLQKLSVVRRITPVRATPQGLEYELDLVSGMPGFNRLLARDGVVDVLEGLEGQPPVYRLR
ncbi:DUF2066 domain-containing protein [Lysobacter auxotrophicus]|uniref:DUF2066 domain-containing protein n=1 Tax=Lysobacter auxotrophicus TaxID=2992573 RepID=A0ABM8DGD4_9GAMM|nr:DUF2066 domain-containing protein [Lysobacter auxotrophicus]BDU17674.1 DUF2066 domain-containing protein [Lysobacter auxotrophicus]